MTQKLDAGNLGTIRFNILKSMLTEFPELKVQIKKEIFVNSLKQKNNPLNQILQKMAYNSRTNYHKTSQQHNPRHHQNTPRKESVPSWAKFAMASVKQGSEKYYVFK